LPRKRRVAVSACLLGRKCRYDGGDRLDRELVSQLEGCEVIPFCPEEAILGAPRETIDLVDGRAIGNRSGRDYSRAIEEEAHRFIRENPEIDEIYLKSKSPSCGLASARLYDGDKRLLSQEGTGLFAKVLKKWYKSAKIEERR